MRRFWRPIATANASLVDSVEMRGRKNRRNLRLTRMPSQGISETADLMDCVVLHA